VCKKWKKWIETAPLDVVRKSKNPVFLGYLVQLAINKGQRGVLKICCENITDWRAFDFTQCEGVSLKFALKHGLTLTPHDLEYSGDNYLDLRSNQKASLNNHLYFNCGIDYTKVYMTKEILVKQLETKPITEILGHCRQDNLDGHIFDLYKQINYTECMNLCASNLGLRIIDDLIYSNTVLSKKETMMVANAYLTHHIGTDYVDRHRAILIPMRLNKDDTQAYPALDFIRLFQAGEIVEISYSPSMAVVKDTFGKEYGIGSSLLNLAVYLAIERDCVGIVKWLFTTNSIAMCKLRTMTNPISMEMFGLFCKHCQNKTTTGRYIIEMLSYDIVVEPEKKAEKISLLGEPLKYSVFKTGVCKSNLKEQLLLYYGAVRTIVYNSYYENTVVCDRGSFNICDMGAVYFSTKDIKELFPAAVEEFSQIYIHDLPVKRIRGLKF
jgi:hypothetical protein